jgi:hypothetical protein
MGQLLNTFDFYAMYFGVLLLIVLIAGRGHAAAVFAHFIVRTTRKSSSLFLTTS